VFLFIQIEIYHWFFFVDTGLRRSSPCPLILSKIKVGIMTNLIRTIAIVDDHLLFRQTISRYLDMLGFQVAMEASNGMELLRLLEDCNRLPTACLVDIEMPVMDGVATTCVLRERYPDMKIVALTQSLDNSKRQGILRAGASSVFFKGMEASELREALFQLLG
jgi:DNA-binding NarL/FixJ family response regulator